jgi:hypothetical protein
VLLALDDGQPPPLPPLTVLTDADPMLANLHLDGAS